MFTTKGKASQVSEEVVARLDRAGDVATVALTGEIDVLTVEQVRTALADAIADRPGSVVVDLSGLSFIDSTGLGALISGFQRARDSRIGFRLARPSRHVRQILVVSGLLEVVELED
jgi:anti-sigma B factor antagonist